MRSLNQRWRFIILLFELFFLCAGSKVAFGVWFPPIDVKGFWFYSALMGLILGSRLDTPHYVKPEDAFLYALPAVFGLFLVKDWEAWTVVERTSFIVALTYCTIVGITGGISMLSFNLRPQWTQQLSSATKEIAQALGTPRALFSVLVVFAVICFHRTAALEILMILLTWIIVAAFAPIETSLRLLARLRALFNGVPLIKSTGELAASQDPNVYLVRQADGQALLPRQVIAINDPVDGHRLGLVLNHVGRDHNQLARVIKLDSEPDKDTIAVLKSLPGSAAIVLDGDQSHRGGLVAEAEAIVGITAKASTLEKLFIETIPNSEIEEGRLVQTTIAGKPVIYQVIKGLLQDEPVKDKNTYGFARAQAKKIGRWDAPTKRFELVKWLPNMNEPVKLLEIVEPNPDPEAIGYFPKTDYRVSLADINALVTHNTAILGILGVGKTRLAFELIERMIHEGIKVICIDLTNDYAKHLGEFMSEEREMDLVRRLNEIGTMGKTAFKMTVEDGGSVKQFSQLLGEEIDGFVNATDSPMLRVINPSQFEVWRQDSKFYNNSAAMASLTPTEVAQIITEATLAATMKNGTSDKARVCIVYEEAHSLVPEWSSAVADGDKSATNGTARAILQGRKYGMGCLLITQRTANVTKTILNQCNTIFAMRSFDATGMEFLKNYIGEDYAGTLSTLPDRHAIFFGKASSCENPVLIRLNDQDKFRDAFRALHAPPPKVVPPAPSLSSAPSTSADDDDLPF